MGKQIVQVFSPSSFFLGGGVGLKKVYINQGKGARAKPKQISILMH